MAATDPSVAPGTASLKRLRLALGIAVVVLAGVALALYVAVRPSSTDASMPTAPVSEAPSATWKARELRAPTFVLRDESGRAVSLAALRGRPVIVTFIDPLCRDFCPTEAKHLNEVVNAFPASAKPAIVAVSVNVYGNKPAILRQDIEKWKLVPQWRWGVGSEQELSRIWRDYHVQVLVSPRTTAGVTVHRIGHTEAAYVIDKDGFQRALFLWPYAPDAVVASLGALAGSS